MTWGPNGLMLSVYVEGRETVTVELNAIEAINLGQALIDAGVAVQSKAKGPAPEGT